MPIYEYTCTKCKHKFEEYLKRASNTPDGCPECGNSAVRKVVSRAAGIVKDVSSIMEKALKTSQEDIKALAKGNESVLENIAGPVNSGGSKKLNHNSKGIKRSNSNNT